MNRTKININRYNFNDNGSNSMINNGNCQGVNKTYIILLKAIEYQIEEQIIIKKTGNDNICIYAQRIAFKIIAIQNQSHSQTIWILNITQQQ